MNTIEISINVIISIIVGAASGFCAFKFLGRKWVENWFEKDLKKYEHKLDVLKIKDEIKFNVLHKERIDIIKKLYQMFFDLNESILHAMMPTEIQNVIQLNINDLLRKNRVKSHEIQMYLLSNEIYIPKILVDRIAGVCYTFDSISKNLMKDKSDENKKRLDEFYTEKVRPLLDNLKNEFRVLLGVELEENTVLK
jgi:hypothetical protein